MTPKHGKFYLIKVDGEDRVFQVEGKVISDGEREWVFGYLYERAAVCREHRAWVEDLIREVPRPKRGKK